MQKVKVSVEITTNTEKNIVFDNPLAPFHHLYSCLFTYNQYKNFKELPSISECKIVKDDLKNIQDYQDEMQEALNLAVKNDTSHIRKLSEIL